MKRSYTDTRRLQQMEHVWYRSVAKIPSVQNKFCIVTRIEIVEERNI